MPSFKPTVTSILTPEDSKRVADALIEKIEEADFDIAGEMRDAVRSVLRPSTASAWKEDWFPLTVEQMCDEISRGVVGAVQDAAEKVRK